MIKIPDIGQIRKADQYTIDHEPISSDQLMERAATACFEWIVKVYPDSNQPFIIVAGTGNNGGDGLVIARKLIENGYPTKVYLIQFSPELSPECKLNLDRLPKKSYDVITEKTSFPVFEPGRVVIDALLGSGISREPDGLVLTAIEFINQQKQTVISIDLPSGLMADQTSIPHALKIINAAITLTIGAPKLALFMPENAEFFGSWHLIPIGLHKDFMTQLNSKYFMTEGADVMSMIKARPTFSHKGTFGHALLMAGSKGKTGAAVLAARACLRSGCGLTTVHSPSESLFILQTAAPEAMVSVDKNNDCISEIPDLNAYSAVAFGPGCGKEKPTAAALKLVIQESKSPLVIDADGLNILAENKTWLAFLPENTILTPHPGEFQRLFGAFSDNFSRLEAARTAARKYRCIIILKGAYTAVVTPSGDVFFNPTGNPGMAKGGSGDVLTGLLAGLLAKGTPPIKAALLGAYLHGLAGDIAAELFTSEAMTAGDLISSLPDAWAALID